jgi:hypothetical protein
MDDIDEPFAVAPHAHAGLLKPHVDETGQTISRMSGLISDQPKVSWLGRRNRNNFTVASQASQSLARFAAYSATNAEFMATAGLLLRAFTGKAKKADHAGV